MEEALIKRIMPNNLEAEQSVIGSMIMDREAIIVASEILIREDFYHQQYGVLFESMVELFNEEKPVDVVMLQNRLREKDVPAELSSMEFVGELVTSVPTSANIKYYANIVKEKAMLRRLIKVNEEIAISVIWIAITWKILWRRRRNRYLISSRIVTERTSFPLNRLS